MLRFRNVFYTISKLFHCPAKVFSEQIVHKFAILCCESYTCILILLCLSIFRSGAISGLGWVWMDGLGSLCGANVWASLCDANNNPPNANYNSPAAHKTGSNTCHKTIQPHIVTQKDQLKHLKKKELSTKSWFFLSLLLITTRTLCA